MTWIQEWAILFSQDVKRVDGDRQKLLFEEENVFRFFDSMQKNEGVELFAARQDVLIGW